MKLIGLILAKEKKSVVGLKAPCIYTGSINSVVLQNYADYNYSNYKIVSQPTAYILFTSGSNGKPKGSCRVAQHGKWKREEVGYARLFSAIRKPHNGWRMCFSKTDAKHEPHDIGRLYRWSNVDWRVSPSILVDQFQVYRTWQLSRQASRINLPWCGFQSILNDICYPAKLRRERWFKELKRIPYFVVLLIYKNYSCIENKWKNLNQWKPVIS